MVSSQTRPVRYVQLYISTPVSQSHVNPGMVAMDVSFKIFWLFLDKNTISLTK